MKKRYVLTWRTGNRSLCRGGPHMLKSRIRNEDESSASGKLQALIGIKFARSCCDLHFFGAGFRNPATLSQIKATCDRTRFSVLRQLREAPMLVQIDSNPRLAAIWHFGEVMCIPVAVLLTVTALVI